MFAGGHCRAPHENGSANYRATDFSHDSIFNDDQRRTTRLSRDSRDTERKKKRMRTDE